MRANNGYMGGLHRHTRSTSHPEDIRRGCVRQIVRRVYIRYGERAATGATLVFGSREGAGASPYDVA